MLMSNMVGYCVQVITQVELQTPLLLMNLCHKIVKERVVKDGMPGTPGEAANILPTLLTMGLQAPRVSVRRIGMNLGVGM